MPITIPPGFNPGGHTGSALQYGVVIAMWASDPSYDLTIRRADDVAGVVDPTSANWVTLAQVEGSRTTYQDLLPNDGLPRWYSIAHIGKGAPAGPYTPWVVGTPRYVPFGGQSRPAPLGIDTRESPVTTASTGSLAITLIDPQNRVTSVDFQTQSGGNAPSAWTSITNPGVFSASVTLDPFVSSSITYRVQGYSVNGVLGVMKQNTVPYPAGVPVPTATIGTAVPAASTITWPFTLSGVVQYCLVWWKEYASEPGTVGGAAFSEAGNAPTPQAIIFKGDTRTAIALPITGATKWLEVSFIPYDQLGNPGAQVNVKAQGSSATPPGAPGTPTSSATTSTSITSRVPLNASAVAGWKVRMYRDGVAVGTDYTLVSGDITAGFVNLADTGLGTTHTYTYTFTHLNTVPTESAASASYTNTTGGSSALTTPVITGITYDVTAQAFTVTTSTTWPVAVTFHCFCDLSSTPTTDLSSSTISFTGYCTIAYAQWAVRKTVYIEIWVTATGYTASSPSSAGSCPVPGI